MTPREAVKVRFGMALLDPRGKLRHSLSGTPELQGEFVNQHQRDEDTLLPPGVFLICGDRAWLGIPKRAMGGPC